MAAPLLTPHVGKLIVPDTHVPDAHTLGREEAEKILKPLAPTIAVYECGPTDVIVVKWIRKKLTPNLLASAKTQQEDEWQGKIGLVLKVGSHAFQDEGDIKFHGFRVNPGDWVQFRNSDGDDFGLIPVGTMNQYHCRRLWHGHVTARIPHPDMVM